MPDTVSQQQSSYVLRTLIYSPSKSALILLSHIMKPPSGNTVHAAAINSTSIPASLLAQLATNLQQAPEAHQHRTTPGAGQALTI